jgi:hypothetical protein
VETMGLHPLIQVYPKVLALEKMESFSGRRKVAREPESISLRLAISHMRHCTIRRRHHLQFV